MKRPLKYIEGAGVVGKKNKSMESWLQIALFKNLIPLMIAQDYSQFIAYAVPNGEKRDPKTAAKLKLMGVMAGAADIELLFPAQKQDAGYRDYNFLFPPRTVFVELKYNKNPESRANAQSPEQKDFDRRVTALGFQYIVLTAATREDAWAQMVRILEANGVKI